MADSAQHASRGPELGCDDGQSGCTVMLRGIACKLTQEHMKQLLDRIGLRGMFSSVYVPCIATRTSNLGYAFVRFRSTEYAQECHRLCNGTPMGRSGPGKVCEVIGARRQGQRALIAKRHRRGDDHGPLFCDDPVELHVSRIPDADLLEAALRKSPSASSAAPCEALPPMSGGSPRLAAFVAECAVCSTFEIFEDDEVDTSLEDAVEASPSHPCSGCAPASCNCEPPAPCGARCGEKTASVAAVR